MSELNGDIQLPRWILWLQPIVLGAAIWAGTVLVQMREDMATLSVHVQHLSQQEADRKLIVGELSSRVQSMEVQIAILNKLLKER